MKGITRRSNENIKKKKLQDVIYMKKKPNRMLSVQNELHSTKRVERVLFYTFLCAEK